MIGHIENAFQFSKTLINQDLQKECVGLTYLTPSKKHMDEVAMLAKQNKKEIICIDAQTLKLCFNPLQHPFGASILFDTFKVCCNAKDKPVELLNELTQQTVSLLTAFLKEEACVETMILFLTDNAYAKSILNQSCELKQSIFIDFDHSTPLSVKNESKQLFSKLEAATEYFSSVYFKDMFEIQSKKCLLVDYLQKLNNNPFLNKLFNSETSYKLNFVDLLNKDNVLIVNTKNSALGSLNYDFNMLLLQAVNWSVEPACCEDVNNLMHFLYIEEPYIYSNPVIPTILSKGESFKISCCFFLKNIDQLSNVDKHLKELILKKICNKFFFKGVNLSTWNYFQRTFEVSTALYNKHLPKRSLKAILKRMSHKLPKITKTDFLNLGSNEFIFLTRNDGHYLAPQKSTY